MLTFLARRIGIMVLTALCLTFIVFFLTNLPPNLEKLAEVRGFGADERREVHELAGRPRLCQRWSSSLWRMAGRGAGHGPGWTTTARCAAAASPPARPPRPPAASAASCRATGAIPPCSRSEVSTIVAKRLALTGWLMLAVMMVMVPSALIIGVLAGMREGSRARPLAVDLLDRLDRDAGICLGRHLHRGLRLLGGRAEMVLGHGDSRRWTTSPSRTSPCRW